MAAPGTTATAEKRPERPKRTARKPKPEGQWKVCLLYTSDAADE